LKATVATVARRRRDSDLERMSYGIGSGVASVVLKPETPEEKVRRILREAPGVRR
jgi:hypothetical protein